MPAPGISKASLTKALSHVDKNDPKSLQAFVESLEKLVSDKGSKARVIPVGEISERDVFDVFGLANAYRDLGMIRDYDIPEIKAKPYTQSLIVPSQAKDVLVSILKTWPPCNESNVRVLISMVIHFVVTQINEEIQSGRHLDPKSPYLSSSTLQVPSPLATGPKTPEKKTELESSSESVVTLKAYTEVLVSFETTTSTNDKLTIRGFIDYGVSYAKRTPEALDTFFAVVEAKAVGKLDEQAWAQLLCYMGMCIAIF